MKIWVILCLAAGPLAARAQLSGGVSLQPGSGQSLGAESVFGWKPHGVDLPGPDNWGPWSINAWRTPFPYNLHWYSDVEKQTSLGTGSSLRMLIPDRMPCLTLAGADAMPIDGRKGRDPMPNGLKQMK